MSAITENSKIIHSAYFFNTNGSCLLFQRLCQDSVGVRKFYWILTADTGSEVRGLTNLLVVRRTYGNLTLVRMYRWTSRTDGLTDNLIVISFLQHLDQIKPSPNHVWHTGCQLCFGMTIFATGHFAYFVNWMRFDTFCIINIGLRDK